MTFKYTEVNVISIIPKNIDNTEKYQYSDISKVSMCSSRKYPYPPPHGRDFLYDPSGFSKSTPTVTPPPPTRLEIPVFYYFLFLYLPPGNLIFNCLVLYFIYQKQLLIKTTSILFTFLYKYINIHGRFMQVH